MNSKTPIRLLLIGIAVFVMGMGRAEQVGHGALSELRPGQVNGNNVWEKSHGVGSHNNKCNLLARPLPPPRIHTWERRLGALIPLDIGFDAVLSRCQQLHHLRLKVLLSRWRARIQCSSILLSYHMVHATKYIRFLTTLLTGMQGCPSPFRPFAVRGGGVVSSRRPVSVSTSRTIPY